MVDSKTLRPTCLDRSTIKKLAEGTMEHKNNGNYPSVLVWRGNKRHNYGKACSLLANSRQKEIISLSLQKSILVQTEFDGKPVGASTAKVSEGSKEESDWVACTWVIGVGE